MSYQVLARKWRPRSFREMVGQTHVLKALISALDTGRLHHAYLFTGTRGVGKTTIARIMAKCLNCEQGVSSMPCGECSVCREIDEGRFVDLIEVDAASKTKVEDTRELLDNVQYMPSRGRYKVYLIDEVHMLSTSSFNALLKTLEEPPEHVKFLLATTDPQKLPATVLSRCLQFSLKNMPPEAVVGHLEHVLGSENIPFEEQALWLLGRAADGSMRDAMSLTDQAVSFGEGKVLAEDVRAMLGTLDQGQVFGVLQALVDADASALLQAIRQLADHGPDWMGVLGEVLGVLHRTTVAQMLPDAVDNAQGDREQILQLAKALPPEDVQFYYQVALLGRRDLPLAPDARDGFEMVMLRMLAFRPASLPGAPRTTPVFDGAASPEPADQEPEPAASPITADTSAEPVAAARQTQPAAVIATVEEQPVAPQELAPWEDATAEDEAVSGQEVDSPASGEQIATVEPEAAAPVATEAVADPVMPSEVVTTVPEQTPVAVEPAQPSAAEQPVLAAQPVIEAAAVMVEQPATQPQAVKPASASNTLAETEDDEIEDDELEMQDNMLAYADWQPASDELYQLQQEQDENDTDLKPDIPSATGLAARWIELCEQMGMTGMTGNIVRQTTLVTEDGDNWLLHLDPQHSALFNANQQKRINDRLNQTLGRSVQLQIEVQTPAAETPALALARRRARQQADAVLSIEQDPVIQTLMTDFGARILPDSIRPLDPL